MSITTLTREEFQSAQKLNSGAPVVKDKWTVADGDYVKPDNFVIKGCLLTHASTTPLTLNYTLKLDDSADAVPFLPNVIHPCGDLQTALQSGTTATTVYFFG